MRPGTPAVMLEATASFTAPRSLTSSSLMLFCTSLMAAMTEERSTVASRSPLFTLSPAATSSLSTLTPLGRVRASVSTSESCPEPDTVVFTLPVSTV